MSEDIQTDQNQSELNIEELQAELEKYKKESEVNLDGWKRTQADFENFRRRSENESKELIVFAREVAVAKLLPSLDSIEAALLHAPREDITNLVESYVTWKAGLVGIIAQLSKALEELGVRKIEAKDKKFDPNFHEAVKEVEGEEDGYVTEELQTGYELNGKVIRPSQVVISKKTS